MKLISINCTIEVSKDANGYSNNYYVDIDEKGVSVSHPYIKQVPEQVTFVNNIINSFIANAINFNSRINVFNKEMGLEEYAPKVVKTEESVSETTEKSVESQVTRGGSEEIDNCPTSMEDAKNDEEKLQAMLASGLKEEIVIATIKGSSNEGLTVIEEE